MPATIPLSVTMPDDAGNAGKKMRTQARVMGGATVHDHFLAPNAGYTQTGRYFFSSTQQVVQASAQNGTSTGFLWLANPVASTITATIRRVVADANMPTVATMPTAPVISFTKFTYTGTASGASVASVKASSLAATAQLSVRTAVTGMTVSLVGDVGQFAIPTAMTPVRVVTAQKEVHPPAPTGYARGMDLELAPGEGLVVWQEVAGTASDVRTFGVQVEWEEMDLT